MLRAETYVAESPAASHRGVPRTMERNMNRGPRRGVEPLSSDIDEASAASTSSDRRCDAHEAAAAAREPQHEVAPVGELPPTIPACSPRAAGDVPSCLHDGYSSDEAYDVETSASSGANSPVPPCAHGHPTNHRHGDAEINHDKCRAAFVPLEPHPTRKLEKTQATPSTDEQPPFALQRKHAESHTSRAANLHTNSIFRSNLCTVDIMSLSWRLRPSRKSSKVPPVRRSWLRPLAPDVAFALGDYKYGGVLGQLKEHYTPRIKRLAQSAALRAEEPAERVEAMLWRLCARPGIATVRFLGWSLGVLWRWVFASVHVDVAGVGRVQRAFETAAATSQAKSQPQGTRIRNISRNSSSNSSASNTRRRQRPTRRAGSSRSGVLLLPTHRSHLDYLLLSYICFGFDLKMPLIAAGDNLAIPIVGHLFRWSGAFFIKRAFAPDSVYAKVVSSYLCSALDSGSVVELFLQGGRSRTGLIGPPKVGLLRMAIDAVKSGELDDVQLVPASVDYDCALEAASYADMLLGKPKEPESLLQVLKSAWNLLVHPTHGCAHVNFAEPVWLGELVEQLEEEFPQDDAQAIARKVGGYVVQQQRKSSVVTPVALVAAVLLSVAPVARTANNNNGGEGNNGNGNGNGLPSAISVSRLETQTGFLIRLLQKHGERDVALPLNVTGARLHSLVDESMRALSPVFERDRVSLSRAIWPSELDAGKKQRSRRPGTTRAAVVVAPTDTSCRLMLRYSCGELPSVLAPFAAVVLCLRSLPRGCGTVSQVLDEAQATFGPIVFELFPFSELSRDHLHRAIDGLVHAHCLWKCDDMVGLRLAGSSNDDSSSSSGNNDTRQHLTTICASLVPYLHVLASVCECLESSALGQISQEEAHDDDDGDGEAELVGGARAVVISQAAIVVGTRALLHDALAHGRCRFPEVLSEEGILACVRVLVKVGLVARCAGEASSSTASSPSLMASPTVQAVAPPPTRWQGRVVPMYQLTCSLSRLGAYQKRIESLCDSESPQVVHTMSACLSSSTRTLRARAFGPALAPLFNLWNKKKSDARGGASATTGTPQRKVKAYLLPFAVPRLLVRHHPHHKLLPLQQLP